MDRGLVLVLLLLTPTLSFGAHTHTTLLNLCKPGENDYDWLDCVNNNWDILDSSGAQTNASAMTTGTLPNARLDSSSVTLYGPTIPASAIRAGQLPATVYVSSFQASSIPGQAILSSTIPLSALNQSGCAVGNVPTWSGTYWVCTTTTTATSYPGWTKYTLDYTNFAKADTSSSTLVVSLPAKGIIHAVKIKHSTAFSGGLISSYKVSVGSGTTGTELARYASAFEINGAVLHDNFQLSTGYSAESETTAVNITATATSVGANLEAASQGSVDIWLLTSISP